MATQSLYRRYRPQRFSEVRGQEHVVKALRNAVIQGKEGQAYLFSGPRGTGKTTSARILAKVLNCERPIDGEPCCECDSCLAVQSGTSFDVHELDAASNNGVDAMRDLIERTKLGTPGRHKVYILDEVHMLSKGAEAALLKTLEEPPPHVVFVLATTDPQKVSDTIRSRTQHLQFHLLPMDVLDRHVRWLAEDAGLQVTDDAIDAVLRRGGGSARDTISALELIAASGGDAPDETPLDDFIEALIDADPGKALTAVASSMRLGRDPRTLAESLVAHLRDCFLALMAPELVALPDARAQIVGELARRLGAATAVRGIETLGSILVEMRHAPDPRVLLEVALVKLASPSADSGTAALSARIDRLERQIASGAGAGAGAGAGVGAAPTGSQRSESSGRPGVSSTASSSPRASTAAGAPERTGGAPSPDASAERAVIGSRFRERGAPTPESTAPPARTLATEPGAPTPATADRQPAAERQPAPEPRVHAETTPSAAPTTPVAVAPTPAERSGGDGDVAAAWTSAVDSLKPIAKARFSQAAVGGYDGSTLSITFPSDGLRLRGEDARAEIEAALSSRLGRKVALNMGVGAGSELPNAQDSAPPTSAPQSSRPPGSGSEAESPAGSQPAEASSTAGNTSPPGSEPRPGGGRPPRSSFVDEPIDDGYAESFAELPTPDDEVDVHDLVDAPTVAVVSIVDRVASHFPGAELIEEDR